MTRTRHLILPAVLLAAALTGCSSNGGSEPGAKPEPSTSRAPLPLLVRGTFSLELPNFIWNPGVCAGRGAHDDITAGTKVVVTDNTGATVAVGALDQGQPVLNPDDGTRAESCMFTFEIADVPSGRGFYGVEVSNRGKVQFKEADLGSPLQLGLT